MGQEPDLLDETELVLIYIAKRIKEALALEGWLTEAGLEYVVEPDTYKGGIIFASERIGAFFYVHPNEVARAHSILRENRFKPYEPG